MTAGAESGFAPTSLPPLPFTVYPERGKQLLFVLVGAAAATVGFFLIRRGEGLLGWFFLGFSGLMLPVFLGSLLPGSSYLTVSELGIESSVLFRKYRLQWGEIAEIGVCIVRYLGLQTTALVGFNYTPQLKDLSRRSAFARAISGLEGGLYDNYGFEVEELAALLAAYHQRFVDRGERQ